MEKIKNLNLYQKGIILVMIAISLLFAVILSDDNPTGWI